VDGLAISPDGRYIAIGGCTFGYRFSCPNDVFGSYAFLVILDAVTAEPVSILPEKETTITGLQFSPDGSQLVYAAYPQRVVLWNIAGQKIEKTLINNDKAKTKLRMKVNPDGRSIAITTSDSLKIIDYESGNQLKELPGHGYVPQYSADGSRLAMNTAEDGNEITVFDTASWAEISRFQLPDQTGFGNSVDISPDGKWIVTKPGVDNPVIRVWDANTGQQVKVLEGPPGQILSIEFSPTNQLLFVSIFTDLEVINKITIWDVNTWQQVGVLNSYSDNGNLSFSADGEFMLATNGKDIWRWSRMDQQIIQSREVVKDFFDALSRGDYEAAAALYQPDKYEIDNLQSIGLDTSDTVSLLKQICEGKTRICLPVLNVLPGGGFSQFGQYEVHLQFINPDGSIFKDSYGVTDQFTDVGVDPEQHMKVIFIPYNE
jgi:WD40 repeat protein